MNDVLSGRGAWFNQHPGNKRFRGMLEEKKCLYEMGTKKQKMEISKAIVEAVYSKNPPGRFLKKCSETGQLKELSRRDAADKAAQAMAYIIKGESLKEKRRQRRFNLPPSSHSRAEGDNNDVGGKSPQSADLRTRLQQHATKDYLKSNHSSSVAHHGLATWREGAAGTSNDVQPDASDLLHVPPGTSNLQQQRLLLQQLNQPNTIPTFPASLNNPINYQSLNRNGLGPQQLQTLQHHLPVQLQYTLVQNPWGQVLQSQTALQPTFNGGLSRQLLDQTQQQQRQQQQLVLQSLSNQQNNVFPSSSVPTTHTMPAGAGSSDVPQGTQQMDQLQRSLMLQQQYNHFMAPSLGTFPNNQLPFQQQMLQPVDPFLQQRLQTPLPLQLQQNLQGNPPPSGINVDGMASAAGAGAQPTRQEESTDKEESEP